MDGMLAISNPTDAAASLVAVGKNYLYVRMPLPWHKASTAIAHYLPEGVYVRRTRPADEANQDQVLACMVIETCFVLPREREQACEKMRELTSLLLEMEPWEMKAIYPMVLADAYFVDHELGHAMFEAGQPKWAPTDKRIDCARRVAACRNKADQWHSFSQPQIERLIETVRRDTYAKWRLGETSMDMLERALTNDRRPTIPPACAFAAAFGDWYFGREI